ncbi:MAG: DUF3788 domain-containing protein [Endomicrobia bacterium]|nr:DUF3788 domain-containing protein [Endomicrobiia bacterium]MCL2506382.1 DUF3788 domain-containing protein [Endomicrobiia bacterium]
MEINLLEDPKIFPSKKNLKDALGKSYSVFEDLETQLTQKEFALVFDWRYYRDSKAWLCKVHNKKKTIFWLSVWDGFFKTSFFFLERHMKGIAALKTNKNSFKLEKEWGKMIPLIFNIKYKKQFTDLLKIVQYKKEAK